MTVTVPAAPWNTAKLLVQAWLVVPLTSVQLVVPVPHVPLPPSTEPLASCWLPSQNCTVTPGTLTNRLI